MLETAPVLLGVSIIVFALLRLVPGDPALFIAGVEATPEVLAAVRHQMGLDQPIPVQYVLWLEHAVQGDFGKSFINGLPISHLVWQRVPATLELATAGLLFATVVGFPLGLLAAVRRGSLWDYLISGFAALALGIPVYLLGILFIAVFSLSLGWFPPAGRVQFEDSVPLALKSLFMPAFALGLAHAPILIRFTRNSILEVLNEDYVRTAHAKGVPSRLVMSRHVLKNAMIPVVTILGITFGRLIGGVVITEAVFAWPGLGTMVIVAIGNRDYGLVQSALLVIVVVFVFINLFIDVLYGWLDPRIRLGQGR